VVDVRDDDGQPPMLILEGATWSPSPASAAGIEVASLPWRPSLPPLSRGNWARTVGLQPPLVPPTLGATGSVAIVDPSVLGPFSDLDCRVRQQRLEQDSKREHRRAATPEQVPGLSKIRTRGSEVCCVRFAEAKLAKLLVTPQKNLVLRTGRGESWVSRRECRGCHHSLQRSARPDLSRERRLLTDR